MSEPEIVFLFYASLRMSALFYVAIWGKVDPTRLYLRTMKANGSISWRSVLARSVLRHFGALGIDPCTGLQ